MPKAQSLSPSFLSKKQKHRTCSICAPNWWASIPPSHLLLPKNSTILFWLIMRHFAWQRGLSISFTFTPCTICFSILFPISNVNEDAPVAATAAGRNPRGQLVIHPALFIIILIVFWSKTISLSLSFSLNDNNPLLWHRIFNRYINECWLSLIYSEKTRLMRWLFFIQFLLLTLKDQVSIPPPSEKKKKYLSNFGKSMQKCPSFLPLSLAELSHFIQLALCSSLLLLCVFIFPILDRLLVIKISPSCETHWYTRSWHHFPHPFWL